MRKDGHWGRQGVDGEVESGIGGEREMGRVIEKDGCEERLHWEGGKILTKG